MTTYTSPPAVKALETLAVRAVHRHHTPGACQLQKHHCLPLAMQTVDRHHGLGRAYRKNSSVQHVLGSLIRYARHFAPRGGWALVDVDLDNNLLRWRCGNPAVPDVVDAIRVSGFDDPRTALLTLTAPDAVLRWCNLADWRNSWLLFPDEPAPVAWCPADDPIHSFEWAVSA